MFRKKQDKPCYSVRRGDQSGGEKAKAQQETLHNSLSPRRSFIRSGLFSLVIDSLKRKKVSKKRQNKFFESAMKFVAKLDIPTHDFLLFLLSFHSNGQTTLKNHKKLQIDYRKILML